MTSSLHYLAHSLAKSQSLGHGLGPLTGWRKAVQGNSSNTVFAASPKALLDSLWGSSQNPDLNKLFNIFSAVGAEKKPSLA